MDRLLPVILVLCCGLSLGAGFLLWGTLRALGRLDWRLIQVEAATPRRRGLAPGRRAPGFRLPAEGGGRVRLRDLSDRRVLLVFADDVRDLQPELDRLQLRGELQIVQIRATNDVRPAGESSPRAHFPVLRQRAGRVSRRYRVLETPFAVVVGASGTICGSGLIREGRHLPFLLEAARAEERGEPGVGWIQRDGPAPSSCRLRDFTPRADDILVVTYPRSGTTWTQMILRQLTTDGGMDFAHIAQVSPWLEWALRSGRDLDRLPAPRVFKSHLSYRRIPKGPCRYIYVARDGRDVAVSYYHFARTHMQYRGTFGEFYDRFLTGDDTYGSWLAHVAGW
jgi:hypothetical protein